MKGKSLDSEARKSQLRKDKQQRLKEVEQQEKDNAEAAKNKLK
jgi:hypothetical protein